MILVTGGSGYVASYVIKELVAQGHSVRALVRSPASFGKSHRMGAIPVIGDVTNPSSLEAAFKDVDQVIHLAAVNRDRGSVTMQSVNAQGSINTVDAAKRAGVKHFVTVVGLGAGADKPYPLARTQGIGVDYLMQSGLNYTVLESSVIFGAGDEFINTLAGLARIPPVMVVPGDGTSKFQPIAAQDVATSVVRSLNNPDAMNKRLQICGNQVLTLEEIIDTILSELKLKRLKLHMPVPLLKVAVVLMEKLLPKPLVTLSLLAQLGVDNVATHNVTEELFGIKPIELRSGISYVHKMTLGALVKRSLGKLEYR